MKKKSLSLLLLLGAAFLAGCGLMPQEEEFRQSPVIRSYEAETFQFTYVERGDVISSTKVSCTFMPAKSESYRFGVSNELLDEIYVRVGDTVQEGQLLAQLDVTSYENAIKNVKSGIARLELQMAHLEERREIDLRRVSEDAGGSEAEKARETVNESYDQQRQPIEDQLYIQGLQLQEYERQLARRRIYAAFTGTVTYVRRVNDGYRSSTYDSILTIADSTTSTFRAQTEYWNYFTPGDSCVVSVGKVEYAATVVSETDLGLPVTEREVGKRGDVYLVLDEINFELEDGDRGSITLILDQRENVLKLPAKAVGKMNGDPVVYYQDEEGVKRYRFVTCGITGNGETEIIDGVTEGEAIITG